MGNAWEFYTFFLDYFELDYFVNSYERFYFVVSVLLTMDFAFILGV